VEDELERFLGMGRDDPVVVILYYTLLVPQLDWVIIIFGLIPSAIYNGTNKYSMSTEAWVVR